MASNYNYLDGLKRIDSRLEANVGSNRIPTIPRFEECGSRGTILCYGTVASIRLLPIEDENTVDESQKLKIIESFFSEVCQVIRSNASCRDIILSGLTITSIYSTALKSEIDDVIGDLACIRSLIPIIEKKSNITRGSFDIRISACYGSLSMTVVESNEISKHFLWNGDAVKTSHKMLDDADNNSIRINKLIWNSLSESNQKRFTPQKQSDDMYVGNIVNVLMNNWLLVSNK